MKIGDFFYNKSAYKLPSHPWIIISDPEIDPDNVLIVNLTDIDNHHDHSCVLDPETDPHEGITKKCCVAYQDANVTSVAALESVGSKGLLIWKEPAGDELLAKILEGAYSSDELKGDPRNLLRSQLLID